MSIAQALTRTWKRPKYNAKRVTSRLGVKFDSKDEMDRHAQLLFEEEEGHIFMLERQKVFPLTVAGHVIANFRMDFVYEQGGRKVAEDFKGFPTADYKLKAKLFRALYPEYIFLETHKQKKGEKKK